MSDQRVVLVTGGTSGIGKAAAAAFVRDGATVVIAGRSAERGKTACEELQDRAEFMQADVSKGDAVEQLVRAIVERHGRLDAAVNSAANLNAGVFKETAAFEESDFDEHMAANLAPAWTF